MTPPPFRDHWRDDSGALPEGTLVYDSDGNLIARLGPPIPDGDEGAFKHLLIPVEDA